MRRIALRRLVRVAYWLACGGAALVAAVAMAPALSAGLQLGPVLAGVGFLIVLGALWITGDGLADHFRALDRLRGYALAAGAGATGAAAPEPADAETEALLDSLRRVIDDARRARAVPDDRLGAVLAAVREAVVAITPEGQVTLVNGVAKAMLGGERIMIGTSVFAAFEREPLVIAMAEAAAGPCTARLATVEGRILDATVVDMGRHRGAVICLAPGAAQHEAELEHDLSLHDRPPDAPPPQPATLLATLPVTVLDTETTGLDVRRDRVVSVAAVRLHGAAIFRASALDLLVDPGVPIPPAAQRVHGISDAMVAGAPAIAVALDRLDAIAAGTVVIGHNIGFDIAVLRAEAAGAGRQWAAPGYLLDLTQLVAALDPRETDLNLEAVAARLGVDVHGRHTALGDCLVTAAIWQALLPRLASAGVETLADAQALAARATRVIARQRAAGW